MNIKNKEQFWWWYLPDLLLFEGQRRKWGVILQVNAYSSFVSLLFSISSLFLLLLSFTIFWYLIDCNYAQLSSFHPIMHSVFIINYSYIRHANIRNIWFGSIFLRTIENTSNITWSNLFIVYSSDDIDNHSCIPMIYS